MHITEYMENTTFKDQYNQPTWLPPGFRFHPTDEELITCYLARKVADRSFRDLAITEVDLNKHEPWDLPGMAQMMGEKEWYFYSLKDRKYPSGSRTNRATQAGYWKATGKDKEIFMKSTSFNGRKQLVGMKKTLVFYEGRAPRGLKSNWVMHEYRIHEDASIPSILGNIDFTKLQGRKEEWAVCRVFHKKLRHGYCLQSKRDLKCSEDDIMKDAKLLAKAARFLLADDHEQLACSSSPSRDDSTSYTSRDQLPLQTYIQSLHNNSYNSSFPTSLPSHSCASSDARLLSPTSAFPLPRFPSDLESFWLHASSFLA